LKDKTKDNGDFEGSDPTGKKGAFWERRYHGTAVETGSHLIRCTVYIDLNMVRAGVVSHPSQWKHGGYHEIVKPKQRYKLVDREALMWLLDMADDSRFSKWYAEKVAQAIVDKDLDREAIWTQELAVGSLEFVERIRKRCGYTSKISPDRPAVVYEDVESYGVPRAKAENLFEW
jgi:putative transposase